MSVRRIASNTKANCKFHREAAKTANGSLFQNPKGFANFAASRWILKILEEVPDAGFVDVPTVRFSLSQPGFASILARLYSTRVPPTPDPMSRDAATAYAGAAIAVGASLDDAAGELESSYARLVREHRRKV